MRKDELEENSKILEDQTQKSQAEIAELKAELGKKSELLDEEVARSATFNTQVTELTSSVETQRAQLEEVETELEALVLKTKEEEKRREMEFVMIPRQEFE